MFCYVHGQKSFPKKNQLYESAEVAIKYCGRINTHLSKCTLTELSNNNQQKTLTEMYFVNDFKTNLLINNDTLEFQWVIIGFCQNFIFFLIRTRVSFLKRNALSKSNQP